MSFFATLARYTALFIVLCQFSVALAQTVPDIQSFKERVVTTAKEQGAKSTFIFNDDDPFLLTVSHGGSKTDLHLDNVYNYYAANPEEDGLDGTIDIVTFLIHNFEKQSAVSETDKKEIDQSDIVIVLRDDNYINEIVSLGPRELEKMIYNPLIGDLNDIIMIDSPETMTVHNRRDLADVSDEMVREIALKNVKANLPSLVVDDSSLPNISLYYIENNPYLTSSLIFFHEFWTMIDEKHPDGVLFALPRTDQLFIVDMKTTDAQNRLKRLIEVTFEDNFNLLSEKIYAYKDREVVLLTP